LRELINVTTPLFLSVDVIMTSSHPYCDYWRWSWANAP